MTLANSSDVYRPINSSSIITTTTITDTIPVPENSLD
jgi:hypothetical protein